jgi:uncharacterized protein (DUF302 family)
MDTDRYTLSVTLDASFDAAEQQVRDALSEQGFGILSEIDVQAALREKLGEDVGRYKILGACNPLLARAAIAADPDIGALLPCNVLLRGNADGGTDVAAADPGAMLAFAGEADLDDIGADARAAIEQALRALVEGQADPR